MFVWNRKDGGPESKVSMYGIEIKSLFSVLLLKFEKGSREAFHSHAFNSVSYVISGGLIEWIHCDLPNALEGAGEYQHWAGDWIKTYRHTVHKVYGAYDTNYVLSLRGPWAKGWYELLGKGGQERVDLTIGRKKTE